jgi:dTDP-glucose pyrophosphorylase
MIAVVPAAGRGTRLGSLTRSLPKALVPVGGLPLIGWVIAGLCQAGIDEIVVVTGHLGSMVERAAPGFATSASVRTVTQRRPRGTADALLAARDIVGEAPFAYTWGDLLMPAHCYTEVIAAGDGSIGVLAVNRVDDPSAGAAVTVDGAMKVLDIVEKPPPGTSFTVFNHSGLGVLPAEAWAHLESVTPSPRGELELTSALASMIAAGMDLRAVEVGPVVDAGTPERLAEGERLVASWRSLREPEAP